MISARHDPMIPMDSLPQLDAANGGLDFGARGHVDFHLESLRSSAMMRVCIRASPDGANNGFKLTKCALPRDAYRPQFGQSFFRAPLAVGDFGLRRAVKMRFQASEYPQLKLFVQNIETISPID